ncbi:MAG: DUF938 domain-containing protein, partial [Bradymonadaceae bacterium]
MNLQDKEFSPACERNRDFILEILQEILPSQGTVLEIGCGTGQHAIHFARHLPHLEWQPVDRPATLRSLQAWSS